MAGCPQSEPPAFSHTPPAVRELTSLPCRKKRTWASTVPATASRNSYFLRRWIRASSCVCSNRRSSYAARAAATWSRCPAMTSGLLSFCSPRYRRRAAR